MKLCPIMSIYFVIFVDRRPRRGRSCQEGSHHGETASGSIRGARSGDNGRPKGLDHVRCTRPPPFGVWDSRSLDGLRHRIQSYAQSITSESTHSVLHGPDRCGRKPLRDLQQYIDIDNARLVIVLAWILISAASRGQVAVSGS